MISQQQTQKQQLKILPQQIQLLNLYFLNTLELEQRIRNELAENPFLEADELKINTEEAADKNGEKTYDFEDWDEHGYDDIPDHRAEHANYFDVSSAPDIPVAHIAGFKEDAKQQLRLMDLAKEDREAAEYLVDILNAQGIMDRQLEEVADDMSFHFRTIAEPELIHRALAIVQTLEPIGIGACSIRECLLIQLRAMDQKNTEVQHAIRLLQYHYNDLMHRQFEKLHHALKLDDEALRNVLNLVGKLKFYPVSETAQMDAKNTIIPDFLVTNYNGCIQVSLYSSRAGDVYINHSLYEQLSAQVSNKDKTAAQYIRGKLGSAQWFVNAVKQRESTMLKIMNCIADLQKDYFADGDNKLLRPMVLRHVAEETGLDISTISRITSNKYAETHFGLIYIKELFSEGIPDQTGEVISNKVIQSVIGDAISQEDKKHPYTDQQLVTLLTGKGYNIARRTVAKYREQMQIPIAQIRAVWGERPAS